VRALGVQGAWLTIKRSLINIYNDVYDEHLFSIRCRTVILLRALTISVAGFDGFVAGDMCPFLICLRAF